jgi:hypothetical protein
MGSFWLLKSRESTFLFSFGFSSDFFHKILTDTVLFIFIPFHIFLLWRPSNSLCFFAETGYAQATLMTILVSIIGPFLVRLLVTWEDWKPAVAEQVVIMKLFFLRALNLSTFLYRYNDSSIP